MKKYSVYVLKSKITGKYYIGYTRSINQRIRLHNKGKNRSTKGGIPWELMYTENYETERDAIRRERELKSWKKRRRIEELIKSEGRGVEQR